MNDVRDVQQIRQYLQDRLRNNPRLRINVQLNQPKIHLTDVDATLTGVYAHIFEIAKPPLAENSGTPCNMRMCCSGTLSFWRTESRRAFCCSRTLFFHPVLPFS